MSRQTGYEREICKFDLELPYQLAPDKTTLKLQGMPTKTTRPTGTLPTGYDTGILIKVPDEQHVLHVGRCARVGAVRYAEQLFPVRGSIHALKQCAIPCLSVQL